MQLNWAEIFIVSHKITHSLSRDLITSLECRHRLQSFCSLRLQRPPMPDNWIVCKRKSPNLFRFPITLIILLCKHCKSPANCTRRRVSGNNIACQHVVFLCFRWKLEFSGKFFQLRFFWLSVGFNCHWVIASFLRPTWEHCM